VCTASSFTHSMPVGKALLAPRPRHPGVSLIWARRKGKEVRLAHRIRRGQTSSALLCAVIRFLPRRVRKQLQEFYRTGCPFPRSLGEEPQPRQE
jgi:hypothetical protein